MKLRREELKIRSLSCRPSPQLDNQTFHLPPSRQAVPPCIDEQSPGDFIMILILIVMDDGGHPFPMNIDGQGQVTEVGDTTLL